MSEPGRAARIARLPWGLIGMLALIAGVERLETRAALDCTRPEGWEWSLSGRAAARPSRRGEVLCFGSSMTKQGILPRVIERTAGRPSYNLALCAGPAPASYVLLRRALDAGARPSAVIVEFHPGSLAEPARFFADSWPDLLDLREIGELAWEARDADLLATLALARCLPTVKDRRQVRANVLAALRGEENASPRRYSLPLRRNVRMNLGAKVVPKVPGFRGEVAPHLQATLLADGWSCHPANARYLGRFLRLAEARRIPVFWVLPPFSPELQAAREAIGADRRFAEFVGAWLERCANLIVIDARGSGYDRSVFVDAMHLDWQGACTLSTDVAAVVARHLAATAAPSRWVCLPPFRITTPDAPLEHFHESVLAVAPRTLR